MLHTGLKHDLFYRFFVSQEKVIESGDVFQFFYFNERFDTCYRIHLTLSFNPYNYVSGSNNHFSNWHFSD